MKIKNLISLVVLALMILLSTGNVNSQTKYTTKKSTFPQWSLTGLGGVSFPVGNFGEKYKSGPTFGIDLSYKVNKEVGFYGKFGYSLFPNKAVGGAPDGKYLQYTAGPRYYFTSKNLKSSLFLEAGIGGYSFMQPAYTVNAVPVAEYQTTNFGVNAGVGGVLNLGRDVDLLFKAKYHNILTPDGSSSFIEPVLGIDIRF
ncbi:MAG: outer membrane beta-barrel protein [Ignavibacteria bacterium]|nr:outer membrane beta-barrel protein [Ignavibacteria bacterium]